jgi:tetratricopeptide (TPR) repeat protein
MRTSKIAFLRNLLLLLISASALAVNSQTNSLDSLKIALSKTIDQKKQIDLLNEISAKYYYIHYDSLMSFAEEAFRRSVAAGYTDGEIVALHRKCDYYINTGDFKTAGHLIEQAERLATKTNNKVLLAESYLIRGDIYGSISIFDQAYDFYNSALQIFNKENQKARALKAENRICLTLYVYNDRHEKALEVFQKVLKGAETIHDKELIVTGLNNVAAMYGKLGENGKALELFNRALRINLESRENFMAASNMVSMASIYASSGNNDTAAYYYSKALEYAGNNKNVLVRNLLQLRRGIFYYKTEDIEHAINDLNEVFTVSEQAGWAEPAMQSAELLAKIYETQDNDQLSLYYLKKYIENLKVFESEGNTRKMAELEVKYDFEKEALRIEALNRRKTILLSSALITSILIIILVIILLIHIRTRATSAKLKHKNEMLEKEQIKQNLANQLELRNKEITSNIILLQKKNEILTGIADKLMKAKHQFTEQNRDFIEKCIVELRENTDDTDWKNFELQFNQIYESFYKKLDNINPNLTVNDRRLCAYLRLNMTTKEIAALTNLSVHSVEVARHRLRKKLQIDDPSILLVSFLEHL